MANLPARSETKPPPSSLQFDDFQRNLSDIIRARFSIVQIVTHEEDRARRIVEKIAAKLDYRPYLWSVTRGVVEDFDTDVNVGNRKNVLTDLRSAIDHCEKIAQTGRKSLFIFLDPYPFLSVKAAEVAHRRRLREFAMNIRNRGYNATCVIIAPTRDIAPELEKEITLVELPLPDHQYVTHFVDSFVSRVSKSPKVHIGPDHELVHALADAAVGLTKSEIENCLAKALVHDFGIEKEDVRFILEEKKQIVRKSGILEYMDTHDLNLDDIGGLEVLKKWLLIRRLAFSADAAEYGVQSPKGVLVTGIPGCGKSLAAKCVATSWGMPLIQLDMGKIFSMWVGSSEENIRNALKTCEAVAPCVLWIDEIEKGLAYNARTMGDSGVGMRVFGTLVTWMQEKKAPVFVFATANDIDALPSELLRKGRFDDIFFVDLPTPAERKAIFEIHLRKHKHSPAAYDMDRLVELSGDGHLGPNTSLTGAEIEAWVNEAMIMSFARRRLSQNPKDDLSMADFEATLSRLVPISRLRAEQFNRMRDWANEHAINASERVPALVGHGRHIDL
ncbi:MAG TPA: AAA family ATPase [Alphaproteobacteria bacterium]|nr:AAA family ATPase [Alphaproteobacteria bacterium]